MLIVLIGFVIAIALLIADDLKKVEKRMVMKKTTKTMKETLMRNERFILETKDHELKRTCIEVAKGMGATWSAEAEWYVSGKMNFYPSKDAYKARRLLDLKMPNNKQLRDCNAKDCLAHGGWLTYVGMNIARFEVGEIYDESDLQEQYWKFANLPQAELDQEMAELQAIIDRPSR